MPTIEQIRAARALIGWSQGQLANESGLSQTGVARIENGTNQPNSNTIEKIENAFDRADIEFIGDSGVKKRTSEIRVLEGTAGFRTLMDDVYATAQNTDTKINISILNGTTDIFLKWLGKDWFETHANRMKEIKDNYIFRIVAAKSEQIATGYASYRWINKDSFYNNCVYIYGNNVAFIRFSETNVIIELVRRENFAATFNLTFNYVWESLDE